MILDNKELAKYLSKRIKEDGLVNYRKTWCQVPTEDDLSFWIHQFKAKDSSGHSEWTWERIHKLGRRSYHGFPADGGIRMQCEKLAAKVSKGIELTEHDVYYLERLENK